MTRGASLPLRWLTVVYVATLDIALLIVAFDPIQGRNFPVAIAGADAANYWSAWQGGLYHGTRLIYDVGAYLYSPAFAEVLAPLTRLPWPLFRDVWLVASLAVFGWLIRPTSLVGRLALLPIAIATALTGGIEWLLCLTLVYGRRWPALWAIPLLTKITPGIGILWFVARREWRALSIAVGATTAVAFLSFTATGWLWVDWIDLLRRNLTLPHYEGLIGLLPLRVGVAAVVVWIGARRNRPEALALAMIVATPDINFTAAAFVLALPRLASASDGIAKAPVERGRARHHRDLVRGDHATAFQVEGDRAL